MYKCAYWEDIQSLHWLKEGIVTFAVIHYATRSVSLGIKQLKPALQLTVSCLTTGTNMWVPDCDVMHCDSLCSLVGDSVIQQGLTFTIVRVEPKHWYLRTTQHGVTNEKALSLNTVGNSCKLITLYKFESFLASGFCHHVIFEVDGNCVFPSSFHSLVVCRSKI